jgi:hypothetical protein
MAHGIPDEAAPVVAWQNIGVSAIQYIWYSTSGIANLHCTSTLSDAASAKCGYAGVPTKPILVDTNAVTPSYPIQLQNNASGACDDNPSPRHRR